MPAVWGVLLLGLAELGVGVGVHGLLRHLLQRSTLDLLELG